MLQIFPIALSQVKVGNNSENFFLWNQTNCILYINKKKDT